MVLYTVCPADRHSFSATRLKLPRSGLLRGFNLRAAPPLPVTGDDARPRVAAQSSCRACRAVRNPHSVQRAGPAGRRAARSESDSDGGWPGQAAVEPNLRNLWPAGLTRLGLQEPAGVAYQSESPDRQRVGPPARGTKAQRSETAAVGPASTGPRGAAREPHRWVSRKIESLDARLESVAPI